MLSDEISEIIKLIEQAKTIYADNFENVNTQDKLTQDLLHKLELDDKSYHEKARTSLELAECRQQRRMSKDLVEEYTPFIEWLDEPTVTTALNKLKNTLGAVRKAESYHTDRKYYPRVS